ncbi:MAG: hypothetical protein CMI28_04455 [Opitutae bacterium]|nr:hypothetical protein [Opitutae bacterium]|tara:strand:- start:5582 stop:5848 length:267 start_codon:yes stop_codon:yes gene_type:complete
MCIYPENFISYKYRMNKKLYYTVIAMALITMATVIFVSYGKKAEKAEQKQVKIKIAPEKQLVKPDDLIEEAIIGDDSQEVVGNETVIM